MSEIKNVITELQGKVLTITINRPSKLNALNHATIEELKLAFEQALDNQNVAGVILTGSGEKAFVAGADISEISGLNDLIGRKFAEAGQEVFNMIEEFPKPVIAAVNGFALGGGCELALACHMRLAQADAKFGLPEVKLGIIPAYGGTQRLTRLVGKGLAMQMILTGEPITAERALKIGLVNEVLNDKESLLQRAHGIMDKILSVGPLAVSNAITAINAAFGDTLTGYQIEANAFVNCCKTEDFKEGTSAFLAKRKAEFKGV